MKSLRLSQPFPLALCLAIAGLIFLLCHLPSFQSQEAQGIDWRFRVRGARPPRANIVLVAIDDRTWEEVNKSPDELFRCYPQVVEVLRERGAAVIAFDVLFSLKHDAVAVSRFAGAIRRAGNVLLAAYLPDPSRAAGSRIEARTLASGEVEAIQAMARKPLPHLARRPSWMEEMRSANAWLLPHPDLVNAARAVGDVGVCTPDTPNECYRWSPLVRPVDNGRLYPHLSLLAAALKLGLPTEAILVEAAPTVRLGDRCRIPLSAGGRLLIDFTGPPLSGENSTSMFHRYSLIDVSRLRSPAERRSAADDAGVIPPDAFRGAVVFIGETRSGEDRLASPYSAENPGVETNANLTNAILEHRFFTETGNGTLFLLLIGIGVILGSLPARQPAWSFVGLTVGIAIAYLYGTIWFFSERRVVLPLVAPMVTIGFCFAAVTAHRLLLSTGLLVRFMPRLVASDLLGGRSTFRGAREASVLFADIRDFTPMSERISPERMTALVEEYLGRMVPIITEEGGTIIKYVGDEIQAIWGAPTPRRDHAARAVTTGVRMLEALDALNRTRETRDLPAFRIGIGINSGEVWADVVGTHEGRIQFDVMGDVVNTASRLQGLNKETGTRLIINDTTYQLARDAVVARRLPPAFVKGKSEALTVYEVLGLRDPRYAAKE